MVSSNSNTKKSFLIFSKKTFQQSSYTWLVGENLEIREKSGERLKDPTCGRFSGSEILAYL